MKTLKYCIKYWWNRNKTNFITDILEKYYKLEYNEVDPDVILCSVFGIDINDLVNLPYLKILYIGESHTRVNSNVFNIDNCITISFDPSSDKNVQYIGQYPKDFNIDLDLIFNTRCFKEELFNRKFCINIISSVLYGVYQPNRIRICDIIDIYKPQDYGGLWRNNVIIPPEWTNNPKVIQNYKFNFCPENASNKYYITEKIVNAFLGNSVPIYWGGDANLIFNEESFINLNNKSDEEIIEIIKKLDIDKNQYKRMFETPLLKDHNFFTNQRNNIERFLIEHIDKIL